MKKTFLIIASISLVLLAGNLFMLEYQAFQRDLSDQPFYWDLFINYSYKKFNKEKVDTEIDSVTGLTWTDYNFDILFDSVWQVAESESEKRPIEWQFSRDEWETNDSVLVGFKNTSGEKMYYMTWGSPCSRLREDYKIYKNGKVETIPFGGFGCGTGIHLAPANDGELVGRKIEHPLFSHPRTNYDLPIEADTFPQHFKSLYGDSVAIRFRQASYANPWSTYASQMLVSDYFVVSTDSILANWAIHKPTRDKPTTTTIEEFYGGKKMVSHPQ